MPSHCCVPRCHEKNGHTFPKNDLKQRNAWINAIKRLEKKNGAKWHPSAYSVVCHNHFYPNDYVEETVFGCTPAKKQLKPGVVPSNFSWSKMKNLELEQQRALRVAAREEEKKNRACQYFISGNEQFEVDEAELKVTEYEIEVGANECVIDVTNSDENAHLQDDGNREVETQPEVGVQVGSSHVLTVENIIAEPGRVHFFTGLESYETFSFVFATLCPAAYNLRYYSGYKPNLPVRDQLFLTLIRLRQNKCYYELSWLFGVTERCASNIFITWTNFIYQHWKEVQWWPQKELVHFFSPSDFYKKFPTTRVIVDGTECPIKKPSAPTSQQATFSTYKNRNTVKVLVGSTPGGLITFVSDAFGGCTSDRQIVERSNLINLCDPKDTVMADKGFNVQDLFAPTDVKINIPTFVKKTSRLPAQTVLSDRKIASKRVHIERLIGLMKTYKILCQPLGATETLLSTEIIFVCAMLCNFRKCIVPKHA